MRRPRMDAQMRMQELRQDAAILAKPKDLANQDGEHSAQDVLLRAEAEVRRIPSPARWRPRHQTRSI